MISYCLMTDATCDLNQSVLEPLDVEVIPMKFMLGDDSYTHYPDMRELSMEDFYKALREGTPVSTTQITPADYSDVFEPVLKRGQDIIYISLSSGLSGTFGSANVAAQMLLDDYPDRRIVCIDSLCASIGEGLLTLLAARERLAGRSLDELVAFIEDIKTKICHWFTVEDLEQLRRGGRLGAASAIIGTALHIHPVLSTDCEGKLRVVAKLRGAKKAVSFMRQRIAEDGIDTRNQTVLIGHGDCKEAAEEFARELVSEGLVGDYRICDIGPVIGSHTGTGMLAMVFIGENYKDY